MATPTTVRDTVAEKHFSPFERPLARTYHIWPALVSDRGNESAVLVLPEVSPRVVQAILRHGSPMQGLIGRRLGRLTQDSLATNSRGPARRDHADLCCATSTEAVGGGEAASTTCVGSDASLGLLAYSNSGRDRVLRRPRLCESRLKGGPAPSVESPTSGPI